MLQQTGATILLVSTTALNNIYSQKNLNTVPLPLLLLLLPRLFVIIMSAEGFMSSFAGRVLATCYAVALLSSAGADAAVAVGCRNTGPAASIKVHHPNRSLASSFRLASNMRSLGHQCVRVKLLILVRVAALYSACSDNETSICGTLPMTSALFPSVT